MAYQVRFEPRAKRELAKIPKKYQEKILAVLPLLTKDPFSGKKLSGNKKLSGKLKSAYSYRVWPYRIIYKIYKNLLLIVIIHVGHRQEAYK